MVDNDTGQTDPPSNTSFDSIAGIDLANRWQWEDDSGMWVNYPEELSWVIEESHEDGVKKLRVDVEDHPYFLWIQGRAQVSCLDGKTRAIRRRAPRLEWFTVSQGALGTGDKAHSRDAIPKLAGEAPKEYEAKIKKGGKYFGKQHYKKVQEEDPAVIHARLLDLEAERRRRSRTREDALAEMNISYSRNL
eukprot:TRINITY_DN29508_c0_g1_i2.p1 TRINITY_DN29508_c0_g1~~TRINITY_DN29508_c0_g1_i2.p1  ORF type:complete len:190 (-),score=35.30 TRINITY_DN29508_c0_g1_i2:311-880(-)